jgi:hypothetical protein
MAGLAEAGVAKAPGIQRITGIIDTAVRGALCGKLRFESLEAVQLLQLQLTLQVQFLGAQAPVLHVVERGALCPQALFAAGPGALCAWHSGVVHA